MPLFFVFLRSQEPPLPCSFAGKAPSEEGKKRSERKPREREDRAEKEEFELRPGEDARRAHPRRIERHIVGEHLRRPECERKEPLPLPERTFHSQDRRERNMGERKQEIEKEKGKAHRVRRTREAPIGDGRRRPDEKIHRREDAKAQTPAALYAIAALAEIADIIGHLLFLLQKPVEAHAVEIAHLHDADDIGIGLARLPVGDRLTADEKRLRRLLLREPRLYPRRPEFFKEFHFPPPLPYHSAKKRPVQQTHWTSPGMPCQNALTKGLSTPKMQRAERRRRPICACARKRSAKRLTFESRFAIIIKKRKPATG